MYYSLLERDIEHEIVLFAENTGIGILVWSPLAMGWDAKVKAALEQ